MDAGNWLRWDPTWLSFWGKRRYLHFRTPVHLAEQCESEWRWYCQEGNLDHKVPWSVYLRPQLPSPASSISIFLFRASLIGFRKQGENGLPRCWQNLTFQLILYAWYNVGQTQLNGTLNPDIYLMLSHVVKHAVHSLQLRDTSKLI